MKTLNTKTLKRSVVLYVLLSMLVLIVVIISVTSYMQKTRQNQLINEYSLQIHHSMKHAIKHYIQDYTYRLHRLSTTTPIAKLLKEKDREGMYKLYKSKWDLLIKEEPNFTIMHVHLKDGTSFLRMHKPELFGDNLSNIRPMIKEIHRSQELITGYEVGRFSAPFRLIEPIFDKDKNYLGALEIGLNPNFILKAIHDIDGFTGMLFIKDKGKELYSKVAKHPIIDNYRLFSPLTPELQVIYNKLQKNNKIKENDIFTIDKKIYQTHLFTLKDFQNKTMVKILFFQDISNAGNLRHNLLTIIILLVTVLFSLLAWFVSRRISLYQSKVEQLYKEQLVKIDESENRFRLLYEKAPEAYQSLDFDGNILMINTKWTEELGYTKEEVVGKYFGDFLTPEFKEKFRENFPKFKEDGGISCIEFEMLTKDSTLITVSFTGKIVYDEKGNFLQTHCIFTNITKQLKLDKELEFNQKHLQTIFDVTPNIMITTNGKEIENANPAMLEFFQYQNLDGFKEAHDCICDFFLGDTECLHSVMDGQHWLNYIYNNPEIRHKVCMLKEGKRHRFLVWAKPLNLDEHQRSIATFIDVTEIEEIRERYEFAVNGSKDGLWDWNLLTNTLYLSPRWKAMIGYKDHELANLLESWENNVHPDDIEAAKQALIDNHRSKNEYYENIHRLRHKDGHWVWVLDRGQTIFDERGRASRMVGYHTDISQQKHLELELRNAQEQFQLFMKNIPAAIVIKDHNNRVAYCNEYTKEYFKGIDLYGKNAYELFSKDEADKFELLNQKAKKEGFAEDIINFKGTDGKSLYARVLTFRIQRDNEVVDTGSIYLDITDQYKDQYKIVQLQAAVQSAPISIMITNLDGEIEYANPWLIKISGYSKEELLGKKPSLLKSDYTSSEEYSDLWETISKGEVWSGTFKNINKEGKEFWESSIISPVFDEHNNIINFIGIKQEITEQVYLKEALVKQADLNIELGAILEEIANEVYIFSKETLKFLYVNKSVFHNIGYTPEEIYHMTPLDIKPKVDAKEFSETLHKLTEEGLEKIFFQTHHQRKDGSLYPVDIYLQEATFEGHNAYMAVIIDTTEQEKTHQELIDKEEIMIAQSRHAAMGEMIGMIAHQWRQPITVIAMGANNILVDIELEDISEERFKEQAYSIIKQTKYLSQTIDDFRNFFRPNKNMEEVKLEEVMFEAEKIIGKSLEDNLITLEVIHENGYKVKTYSRELLQVYINLLKNSKEALAESQEQKRHITVTISDDEEHVITEVCDNGGGINPDIIDKIFDPYFSTKDAKNGTGLGLYMSKTIIEKHLHGSITAENRDEGVCFTLKLPIQRDKHE